MKNIFILLISLLLLNACNNKPKEKTIVEKANNSIKTEAINGVWQRDFEPMPNANHHVEYIIDDDSIAYSIHGVAVNLDYKVGIDTIVGNRIVAHNKNSFYVLFIEPYNQDSVAIFKEDKSDFKEALNFPEPAKDYKANHNQGWNIYYTKKD